MRTLPFGSHLLRERKIGPTPAACARFAVAICELVSAVFWRTDSTWFIPLRKCPDTLLFVAVDGAVELHLRGQWHVLKPGCLAIIPAREPHRVRYYEKSRSWNVIALHLLHHDTSGTDPWSGFVVPIHAIPSWGDPLLDLVALHNRNEARAAGPALLRALAASLLLAGAEYEPPPSVDLRIAAALRLLSDEPGIAITDVGKRVGLGPARFRQHFREVVGIAPKAWLQRYRLERAAHLLATSTDSIQAIAAEVAFKSDQQFHLAFKRAYRCTAGAWRRSAGNGP